MSRARRSLLLVALLQTTAASLPAAEPAAASKARDRLAWFNKAKFGLFIHWGPYAVPAGEWGGKTDYGEWIMLQADIPMAKYEGLARQLNPVKFDAKEWVTLAKDAGMNYLVITAKHHDGFAMYDSKLTDYDIVDWTPFKRDPVKELAHESRKAGLNFSVYYSIVDWHHPDFPAKYSQIRKQFPDGYHGAPRPEADIRKYADYQMGQVKELLTNYGDIGILWFDGGGSFRNRDRKSLLQGETLVDMIHTLQPQTLINNRLGFGSDYGTPEQHIPAGSLGTAFEVCMTLNRHWGYNKNDHDWKSTKTIVDNLADIASKGGNYLLNVGPTAEGVIPPESVKILREVGQWLKVNGEAIYDSTAGPAGENIRAGAQVRMTQKPGRLYLTVLEWPKDQTIFMEGMKGALVKKAYLLADPEKKPLALEPHERSLTLRLPVTAPDALASVIVLELSGAEPLEEAAPAPNPAG
jgi:alpha-L-fucosidase